MTLADAHFKYSFVFAGLTNSNLVVSYFGTQDQFTAIITSGKLKTGWNIIKAASGSTPAVTISGIKCSDGILPIGN